MLTPLIRARLLPLPSRVNSLFTNHLTVRCQRQVELLTALSKQLYAQTKVITLRHVTALYVPRQLEGKTVQHNATITRYFQPVIKLTLVLKQLLHSVVRLLPIKRNDTHERSAEIHLHLFVGERGGGEPFKKGLPLGAP